MDLKINDMKAAAATSSTAPKNQEVDNGFKFTLISNIKKDDLAQKLSSLMKDIEDQGNKIAKHMDIKDMNTVWVEVNKIPSYLIHIISYVDTYCK